MKSRSSTNRKKGNNVVAVKAVPQKSGKKKLQRNGHAFHPIMRKGGPHEKSNGAKRASAKRVLQRTIDKGAEGLIVDFYSNRDQLSIPLLLQINQ